MKSLKQRSDESEMMDNPGIDKKLLQKNLDELDILNRYFGGHSITLQGLKKLIGTNRIYTVVDIGCGSGDVLKYLAQWARKHSLKIKFTGVDVNVHAVQYLKRKCVGYPEISGVLMDYKDYLLSAPPADVYTCSLFCHHLDDTSLIDLLKKLKTARTGFVINDLQRSKLAYYSAFVFTRLFNGSVLSKNDGPISVLRAFTRNELEQLLGNSGITNYSIQWKWAFRYQIIVRNH